MWRIVALMMIGQPEARPLAPADAIAQAAADLIRLPFDAGQHTRYLSLYNMPAAERAKVAAVLNGHCNGLSREPDLTLLATVPNTAGSLLRLDLRDYRWDRATWEKLSDPYFTVTVETETLVVTAWEGGLWEGKHYAAGTFEYKKPVKVRTQQALAPWLTETAEARDKLEKVIAWTQSKLPVVRADWFFNATAASADGRTAGYYDFLAVRNEKDFQRLAGVDVKLAEERKSIHREAVALSGVARNARAIMRLGAIDAGFYKTLEFATNKDKKNPLRIIGKDIESEFDGTEAIGSLPNGLLAYYLGNNKGNAVATVPDNLASDGASESNDRRVHVNASCIRCHNDGGLQSIEGWVKNLLTTPLVVASPDYEKARELRREYARDLEAKIKQDRASYEVAIKQATGLDSKQYSAAHAAMWAGYEDRTVGIDEAAADLGTTRAKLAAALDAAAKANTGDLVVSVLLLNNPRINRVPVRVWEDSFPAAMLMMKGYRQ